MRVSVIIASRDRRDLLRVALRSALAQRDVGTEIVIVDDASTDGTSEMIERLDDPRIRVIRSGDRQGVSASRNRAAAEATGEWLAFLDDDDVWAPDKLARELAAAEEADRTWSYTGWVVVDEKLRIISGLPPPRPDVVLRLLRRTNALPSGCSNVIVRRDVFELEGGFDRRLTNGEDWELWLRLAVHGSPACVPEPLMAYRLHPAMASLDVEALWSSIRLIEQRHRTRVDRGSIERWVAESYLRTGDRARALKYLGLAAAHGSAAAAGRDVVALLRRRVARRLGRPAPRVADRAWAAAADRWLAELRSDADPPV